MSVCVCKRCKGYELCIMGTSSAFQIYYFLIWWPFGVGLALCGGGRVANYVE